MNGKTTTTTNAFSDDDIRDKLAYILPYDLNFSLNNTFYYLKITKTANDIELIFLSGNEIFESFFDCYLLRITIKYKLIRILMNNFLLT